MRPELNKEKFKLVSAGAIVAAILIFSAMALIPDETLEDCLLKRIKGLESQAAIDEIRFACEAKTGYLKQGVLTQFNEYFDAKSLSKCGITNMGPDWYPPVGHVTTKKIVSNLKNVKIKWSESDRIYKNTSLSFQNNNNFSIDTVVLGLQSRQTDTSQAGSSDSPKNSFQAFSPEVWLENQKKKMESPIDIRHCYDAIDRYEAIMVCSDWYRGVGQGKFGVLKCDATLPQRLVGMDVCLVSAGPTLNDSTSIWDFTKAQNICK